jgi:hypothetical protein
MPVVYLKVFNFEYLSVSTHDDDDVCCAMCASINYVNMNPLTFIRAMCAREKTHKTILKQF